MKNVFIFFLIFCISAVVFPKGMQMKVAVRVTADDVIKDQVLNDINKSLRSYDDIDLVDENQTTPDYVLDVMVVQTKNKESDVTGYACSINVVYVFKGGMDKITTVLETKKQMSLNAKKVLMTFLKDSYSYPVSSLLIDPDLSNLIDRVVAFANTEVFEVERKANNSQIKQSN